MDPFDSPVAKVAPMFDGRLDLVGDVRGETDALVRLLSRAFHTGERAANAANQAFVGGYTTGTVGARYAWTIGTTEVTAQLNVDNVADKVYWSSAGNGLLGVSLPRTTRASLTAKF